MECKVKCYTVKEKILLAQLVKDNKLVENKKTDAVSVQEKNEAWRNICEIYTSQPEVEAKRNPSQLRKLWNNLKQRKRKETIEYRHSMLLTGGGPSIKIPNDPVMELVEDAAPNIDINIENVYDSTSSFEKPSRALKLGQPIMVQVDKLVALPITQTEEFLKPLNPSTSKIPPNENSSSNNDERYSTPRRPYPIREVNKNKAKFIAKTDEAIRQQQELHEIKMEIARKELIKVEEEIRRAKAEADLAALKLQRFKNTI